jgi:hypothetical protein
MLTSLRKRRNANETIKEERKKIAKKKLMIIKSNLDLLEKDFETAKTKYSNLLEKYNNKDNSLKKEVENSSERIKTLNKKILK